MVRSWHLTRSRGRKRKLPVRLGDKSHSRLISHLAYSSKAKGGLYRSSKAKYLYSGFEMPMLIPIGRGQAQYTNGLYSSFEVPVATEMLGHDFCSPALLQVKVLPIPL